MLPCEQVNAQHSTIQETNTILGYKPAFSISSDVGSSCSLGPSSATACTSDGEVACSSTTALHSLATWRQVLGYHIARQTTALHKLRKCCHIRVHSLLFLGAV